MCCGTWERNHRRMIAIHKILSLLNLHSQTKLDLVLLGGMVEEKQLEVGSQGPEVRGDDGLRLVGDLAHVDHGLYA